MMCVKEGISWLERSLRSIPVLDSDERDRIVREKIERKEAFLSGKFGGNELWAMRVAEFGYWYKLDLLWEHMNVEAGFFYDGEKREAIERFTSLMKDAVKELDQIAEWQKPKEYYFLKKYRNELPTFVNWVGIDMKCLKGRKVLIVHPFEKTIRNQYERREKIFDDPDRLPDMDLSMVKAVQTIGGNPDPRFKNWFQALDYMTEESLKRDFDVALIGCGAYGLPLAARIKKEGKCAIHLGGELQLLFGIKGKRWTDDPHYTEKMNEYWVNPFPEDVPENYEMVEGGCYW